MTLVQQFQNLVAQVPELIQPLVVALAGAVPMIEGEGAAALGILGGITPIVAAIAAVIGNFACVTVLVLLSARARQAVLARRHGAGAVAATDDGDQGASIDPGAGSERAQARRAKFQRSLTRYGVPGVSLLGPLLLPTQFTATMLAAAGVGRSRILTWQGIAIVGWTTAITLLATGVISVVA